MTEATFVIESNIAIPPRTIPNAGPRDSKYPVDQMEEGQGFAIPISGADAEAIEKSARQKQSQMSGLAKARGIKLVTRFYPGGEDGASPFASVPAPCLGVWHGGKADPKKPKAKKADGEQAEQNADAGTQAAAETQTQTPAAADDVVEL